MTERRVARLPEDPAGIQEPHDILAAEEFAMPTRSSRDIPPDPTGIQQPHDTLAAEEFAMPTGGGIEASDAGFDARTLLPGALLLLVLALLVRRLRS